MATHLKALKPGTRRTLRDHMPPQAKTFFERDRQWCVKQATEVGPQCTQLIEQLLGDRIAERLRAAQGVLALGKRYGPARLEAACQRALAHDSVQYRTVKTILATNADMQPMSEPSTPAAYARSRFVRSAASLFTVGDAFDGETSTLH